MRRWIAFAASVALVSCNALASPLGPDGTTNTRLPGKFTWLELATENPASAKDFYGAVFGWKFRDAAAPAAYTLIENDTGKVAGVFQHARPANAAVGARWLPLISVANAATAAQAVRDRGGQVLLAPRVVLGRGPMPYSAIRRARYSVSCAPRTATRQTRRSRKAMSSGSISSPTTAPNRPRSMRRSRATTSMSARSPDASARCFPRMASRERASRGCTAPWESPHGCPTSSWRMSPQRSSASARRKER
jgi:predicted enzyme related to lactoylglutathione lyase